MREFLYKGKQTTVQILFKYADNGFLIAFECEGPVTPIQLKWLYDNMPKEIEDLDLLRKKYGITIIEVEPDLSFDNFYNTYNYKVGNKKRAESLWNSLTKIEKALALSKIKSYAQWLRLRPNQDKAYPETYLSQRRYENDFR